MKLNKKKVLVASLAISLIAILSFGTIAWFNATDEITNTFKIADSDGDNLPDFDVDVFESNDTEDDGNEYLDILPGAQLAKDPTVKNTGDYDMYTRVIVTLSDAAAWISASGKYDLTGDKDDTYILEELVTINDNWKRYDDPVRDVDGDTITYVYYYNGVLDGKQDPDAQTSPVFEEVIIPTELQQGDMNYGDDQFTIKVKAEAIQSDNIAPETPDAEKNAAYNAFITTAGWTAGTTYEQSQGIQP